MEQLIYLDNAATTPVRPEVREAVAPYLGDEKFGNPSSSHRIGRTARAALEEARRRIAEGVGAEPHDVVFTSGGTEADNLAIIGGALAARSEGRPFRVAVSGIEHKAVLDAAHALKALGGEHIVLPVDSTGRVDTDAVRQALDRGVAVLSVMWVNNEVGVVQNVAALADLCAEADTQFHTDAVQAVGKVSCSMTGLPATCLAISGHKLGAPKGIGALVVRDQDAIKPLLHGGGQQRGLRPGTENMVGAVGLGVAVELAVAEQQDAAFRTRSLRDDLEHRLLKAIPDIRVNGGDGERACHISNISFADTDSGSLLMHLDLAGICCSSGSACAAGALSSSHVLTAMGVPADLAMAAIRFSFSHANTEDDVDQVVQVMPRVVEKVRKLNGRLGA